MAPDVLLEEMIKGMVDFPDDVNIESHITEHTATFDIHVADSDVGKVLGRDGVYPKALRRLFGAIYGKQKMRLNLQVIDPRR